MKRIIAASFAVSFAMTTLAVPAFAGAPACWLDRPQTCSSYDYIRESINGNGELCRTRFWSDGGTQKGLGLGCTPLTPPAPAPQPPAPAPQPPAPAPQSVATPKPVEPEKPKFEETCSKLKMPTPLTQSYECINELGFKVTHNPAPITTTTPKTEVVSTVPSEAVSVPTVVGNRNNVSTITSSVTNNVSSVQNNTSNVVNNVSSVDASNKISSTTNSNDYRIITVSGGYLVLGADGAAKFFPSSQTQQTTKPVVEQTEVVYLDREDLPKSLFRAVGRLPEELKSKKSIKLPSALRNAESISEDVCVIEKGRLIAVTKGTCVLEVVVNDGIYEHEIEITK
jgi:hypothetical protein